LWTLERGLGDAWTREVADAWTAAYGTLSGYMIARLSQRRRRLALSRPITEMRMRDERILIFEGSFVAVIAPDRSFEVARMDRGETT